jgi:pimeloyl-ACP methyl ester carboxylesterase
MTTTRRLISRLAIAMTAMAAASSAGAQQPVLSQFTGSTCVRPATLHCPDKDCLGDRVMNPGQVVEMKSRRTYFLDYPCDLKPDEKVTVVLSLHGAGSWGNWQRHYFPILDYVDKYRLVVATPNSPTRTWSDADDEYLQNIVSSIVEKIGAANVKAFWLVGHSQGGLTSNRIIRTDFFKSRVDGWLSLSGGRLGGNPGRGNFGAIGAPPAGAAGGRGGAAPGAGGRGAAAGLTAAAAALRELPAGDFSFIFETGEREMDEKGLPAASEWASKYACGPRRKSEEIADAKAGYVYDSTRQNPPNPPWGLLPRPGTAQVFVYPNCTGARVVADVVRLDKGHTEGLEPAVTEALVKLMISAPGGKIAQAR